MIGRIGRLLAAVGVLRAVEVVADMIALAVHGAEAVLVTGHRRAMAAGTGG